MHLHSHCSDRTHLFQYQKIALHRGHTMQCCITPTTVHKTPSTVLNHAHCSVCTLVLYCILHTLLLTHCLPGVPRQSACRHSVVALLHAQHSHPVDSTVGNCSPKCAKNSSPIHTSRVTGNFVLFELTGNFVLFESHGDWKLCPF